MTEKGCDDVTTQDPLLIAIRELRKEMADGFKDLGIAIEQRKDAQHELQLECGGHRGKFDQRLTMLEKDRDDGEEEIGKLQQALDRAEDRVKGLEDEKAERDTIRKSHARMVKFLVPLASAGGLGTAYQLLQALGVLP